MEQKDKVKILLNQLFEISMRINLETDFACFFNISGHVNQVSVTVAKGKKVHFLDKFCTHEFYYLYDYDYGNQDEENAFILKNLEEAIKDLNLVLSKKFSKKFTAWCNLIDMSCQQVFTSEHSAKEWVKKMKRKYNKVGAIVGYKEELV